MRRLIIALSFVLANANPYSMFPQAGVDRELLNEIFKIKAIDNHAHPLKYVAEGDKPDDEFDALPLDAIRSRCSFPATACWRRQERSRATIGASIASARCSLSKPRTPPPPDTAISCAARRWPRRPNLV